MKTKNTYKVLVAHPGKQHSMQTAVALENNGYLYKYVTCVYDKPHSITNILAKVLRGDDRKKANSRKNEQLPDEKIVLFCEFSALILLLISRIIFLKKFYGKVNQYIMDRFGLKVAKYAIKNNIDILIMYDTTSNKSFEYIKKNASHIKCVLDVTIANRIYNKKIYENDIELTNDNMIKKEQEYLWKKNGLLQYYREVVLCDYCLVASEFVRKSVRYVDVADEKIKILRYGVDMEKFKFENKSEKSGPLNLLYVGGIIRRKGLHHLLRVISEFDPNTVKLKLAGNYDESYDLVKKYKHFSNIEFLGYVTKDRLNEIYNDADAFVLPSLSEGMALVGLEAMASGLPLICSTNTGINDLINDYQNGIVFETGNNKQLHNAIEWFYHHKQDIVEIGLNAHKTASQYSWESYSRELIKILENIMSKEGGILK